MSDSGEVYNYGNEDAATLWRIHYGIVLDALFGFVESGRTFVFDFGRAPSFNDFHPDFLIFHLAHIRSIAELIQPPLNQSPQLSSRERYELIAPHVRSVIEKLYSFEQIEFMCEEIQADLRCMLTYLEGITRNASFNQCFHGTEVPNPKSCGAMARRA